MELQVEVNSKKLQEALRRVPGYLRIGMSDALDHSAKKFFKTWKAERLQGPPGVRVFRGGLLTRFKKNFFGGGGNVMDMGVSIYTDSKTARLHETGGTVTAGSGKLAVPLSRNKEMYTASGQLRKRFRDPGQLKNVEPVKIKGKTYLAKIIRKTREIKPLYVLKRSVRLKPRLQFYQTWEKLQPLRMQYINKAISKALKRA